MWRQRGPGARRAQPKEAPAQSIGLQMLPPATRAAAIAIPFQPNLSTAARLRPTRHPPERRWIPRATQPRCARRTVPLGSLTAWRSSHHSQGQAPVRIWCSCRSVGWSRRIGGPCTTRKCTLGPVAWPRRSDWGRRPPGIVQFRQCSLPRAGSGSSRRCA